MIFGLAQSADLDELRQSLIERLEQISQQHKQDLEELCKALTERIAELEEEVARIPATKPDKKPEEMTVVRGRTLFSQRKKEYERAHRKDGLNPTARQIARNDEEIQKAAKTRKADG